MKTKRIAGAIDGKFHAEVDSDGQIQIVSVAGQTIPADEPLFLLRARDDKALMTLYCYEGFCKADARTEYRLNGIRSMIQRFEQFRREHPVRMKQPGITKGAREV